MTIIGVTDEAKATVEKFMTNTTMKYLIAIKGAEEYKTSGIPHAWLVSPDEEIVWDGHPGNLKDSIIEEHIKNVRLTPTFDLPSDLDRAERLLNGGKYADGIKELERLGRSSKTDEVKKAAEEAITKVKEFGDGKLKDADRLAGEGYYADAIEIVTLLEKTFKGIEVGDKAKEKNSAWKRDPKVKAELEAGSYIDRADLLIKEKKYRDAAAILQKIIKTKKYDETKAKARAEAKFNSIKSKV